MKEPRANVEVSNKKLGTIRARLRKIVGTRSFWVIMVLSFAICIWLAAPQYWVTVLDTSSLHWKPVQLLFIWIGLGAAIGVIVHLILIALGRALPPIKGAPREPHDIEGHFLGVVGVLYAVLVAFVVVTAWQARDQAEAITLQEQHGVDDVFHLYKGYPDMSAQVIMLMLRDYATYTAAEWIQMRYNESLCSDSVDADASCLRPQGAISKHANELAHCIRQSAVLLRPSTLAEQAIYEDAIRTIQNVSELRSERRRRYENRTLQPVLWWSFIVGAVIILVMKYSVVGQHWSTQVIRSAALFAMVGMMLALALIFDRPFEGEMQVDGSGWYELARHFDGDVVGSVTVYKGLPKICSREAKMR